MQSHSGPSTGGHLVQPDASDLSAPAIQAESNTARQAGIAPIRAEYLVQINPGQTGQHERVRAEAGQGAQGVEHDQHDAEEADDAAEAAGAVAGHARAGEARGDGEAPSKKLKGAARKKAKRAAAAQGGSGGKQNKGRKFGRVTDAKGICHAAARGAACTNEHSCKFSHDIKGYLLTKPRDLHFPRQPQASSSLVGLEPHEQLAYLDALYTTTPPFVRWPVGAGEMADEPKDEDAPRAAARDIDDTLSNQTRCPSFDAHRARGASGSSTDTCPAGWKCRFLGAHVSREVGGRSLSALDNLEGLALLRFGPDAHATADKGKARVAPDERNYPDPDSIRALSRKKYPLPLTRAATAILDKDPPNVQASGRVIFDAQAARRAYASEQAQSHPTKQLDIQNEPGTASARIDFEELENSAGASSDLHALSAATGRRLHDAEISGSTIGQLDSARIRPPEKRRLQWKGELYLAPLTTTGNLPFRRMCTTLGADITCGEMGLSESYMQGSASEWSLVRRWEGERIFGTQLCGGRVNTMISAAEALATEVGDGLDFVDINCGCPIDLIYNRGAGSALLDSVNRMGKIARGVSAVMGEIPVTVKLRTGTSATRTVHKVFPRLQADFGVGAATLHGRSRKQRYKNEASWEYIGECVKAYRDSLHAHNEEARTADEEEMLPIPIYGNGDVYDWRRYYETLDISGVDGEMFARGALVKPWVFTEVKEKRDWDISSRERLDLVRQYAEWGLTHWGSDTQGVNTCRRYLCEYLSFTCRYIPVGLLESLPAKLNDRPPAYKGRDELETLLASTRASDWVRLSEMFLGRSPSEFTFQSKHKSSSYEDNAEQQG
ncbi:Uncharacterized conserved protein [Ceraceosorus bombacis]|uniref:tRNA-dihydrouridine(47) synthase [NAD(P)(+)] n=1 Tax=Ceraceosorus bombacis TaxID=401625 RepID=A0A0N7L9X5_9BASI|nr:Uncharacterized conserved protein [Ceraceosorus bombacis]